MILADRLRSRMSEKQLSQSELARRIGVSQTTINRLLSGGYGSKHLHRVARELGVTPDWLIGDTEEPDDGDPGLPLLGYDERELVACFSTLDRPERSAVLTIVRGLCSKPERSRLHSPSTEYRGEMG